MKGDKCSMLKKSLYKQSTLFLTVCLLVQIISAAVIGLSVYASSEGISVEFFNGNLGANVGSMN